MIISIVSFLFVLGVLVIVHELGHLLAAKMLNIKVETFSIGFGPKIIGFRKGDTDYILSLLPLGGFVKLSDEPPKDHFYPRSPNFSERPPLDKIAVSLAGPAMNLMLAFILWVTIYAIGVKVPAFLDEPPIIGWVTPESPAQISGLKPGDNIAAINKTSVSSWEALSNITNIISIHTHKQMELSVKRNQETIQVIVPTSNQGELGFYPKERVRISHVVGNSPADSAGLKTGDEIVAINHQQIFNWNQLLYLLANNDAKALIIDVLRDNKTLSIGVHPEMEKNGKRYIGISHQSEEKIKIYSLMNAVKQSLLKINENIILYFQVLWKLMSLDLSIKTLGGPIMIAQVSGTVAQIGVIPLLSFMAALSIQLGLLNLLPFIPIVDGGQTTFYIYEIIRKRPIQLVTLERASKIGWTAMILLFIVISYNDIIRLIY